MCFDSAVSASVTYIPRFIYQPVTSLPFCIALLQKFGRSLGA